MLSFRVATVLLVVLISSCGAFAYSVLTHEEIVDLLWAAEIRPLLLKRFPALTEEQITEAHGYAYGGAVIQDLATTRLAAGSSATSYITYAAETSFAN